MNRVDDDEYVGGARVEAELRATGWILKAMTDVVPDDRSAQAAAN